MTTTAIATLEQHIEKEVLCGVCNTTCVSEKSASCQACDAPYHPDCWEYAQNCATFGCMSSVAGQSQTGKELTQPAKQDFTKTYVKPVYDALETLLAGTPHADEVAKCKALYITAVTRAMEPPMVLRALEAKLKTWKTHYRNRIEQANSPELQQLIEQRHEIGKMLEEWEKYVGVQEINPSIIRDCLPKISSLPQNIPPTVNKSSVLIFKGTKECLHALETPVEFSYDSLLTLQSHTPIGAKIAGYTGGVFATGFGILLAIAMLSASPPLSVVIAPACIMYTNTGGHCLEYASAGDYNAFETLVDAYTTNVKKLDIIYHNHNNPQITSEASTSMQE